MQFQFENLSDFFAMGGYGFYVWLSFGLSLVSILLLIWQNKQSESKLLAQIRREQVRAQQMAAQKQESA